jgi:hypothetical protein
VLSDHEHGHGYVELWWAAARRGEAQKAGLVQCRNRLERGSAGRPAQLQAKEARGPLKRGHFLVARREGKAASQKWRR